jgi:hypothetical protein
VPVFFVDEAPDWARDRWDHHRADRRRSGRAVSGPCASAARRRPSTAVVGVNRVRRDAGGGHLSS